MVTRKSIRPYHHPAGGWGALKATGEALVEQGVAVRGSATLLHMNQPQGFDCPGCAWPDPKHTSSFEFCENGAKAVAWEATAKRCTPAFFAAHTVSELAGWGDYELEMQGRLTHPMVYDAASDRYVPIGWDDALALVARHLNALPDPNAAEFYTSGRTSNEAAFLYQLFGREYGTNNFPDCSNMCHEATSVGLPESLGVAKGTVLLEDFDHADAIFIFGQNPGTNSPRMMTSLRNASRRGAHIISFNPFRERSLERFQAPQDPIEMVTLRSTRISESLYQVRVGGDVAALKGMMKVVIDADDAAVATGAPRVVDADFIRDHTAGFERLAADLRTTPWEAIERQSGLNRDQTRLGRQGLHGGSQHHHCVWHGHHPASARQRGGGANRQSCAVARQCRTRRRRDLPGARPFQRPGRPYRRHHREARRPNSSSSSRSGSASSRHVPTGTMSCWRLKRWCAARSRCSWPSAATSPRRFRTGSRATRRCAGSTSPYRSRPSSIAATSCTAGKRLILPCLGRTEIDVQASGPQSVTVEDSMSMVHASMGMNTPASEHLRSEPAIVAGLARATLGDRSRVNWEELVADYDRIRDAIEAVFPIFQGYNARIRVPGGFHLTSTARERIWTTPSGRANFVVFEGLEEDPHQNDPEVLWLTTLRSHDQYNTTLYSMSDRYRGVFGQRDVVFINARELAKRGLKADDRVDLVTASSDGLERIVRSFRVVEYKLPDGCCGAYYPEANPLVPLYARDPRSHTPSSKAVPIRLVASAPAVSSAPAR